VQVSGRRQVLRKLALISTGGPGKMPPTKITVKSPWSAEITASAKAVWTAWKPEVFEPLGIKVKTATKRAGTDGKGGTRAAMLAQMAVGYTDAAIAAQVVACIRHTYLGCAATNTNGISFAYFTVQSNLADVAPNAVFRAEKDGTMRMVIKPRIKVAERKAVKPKALPSANGPVVVVRPSDKALAEAAAGS